MSWFTSLKEKSLKLAQLYKHELSDFMTNLNDEIVGKNHDTLEETPSCHQVKETPQDKVDSTSGSQSQMTMINFLRPFVDKAVKDDQLQQKMMLVLSDPEGIKQDSIMRLILPDRTDFTSFRDFQKYCIISGEDYEKLVDSDPDLQKLLKDDHLERDLEGESSTERLQCFLYYIIYLFEEKDPSVELQQPAVAEEEEIIFPRDDDGAIQNAGDALENKTELSDPYIVEDGSSNSHSSNSNDTERIESGQRDVVSMSGSDDWQVEEKNFGLEFNG